MVINPSSRSGEDQCSSSSRQAGSKRGKLLHPLTFYIQGSIQAPIGLDDAQSNWGGGEGFTSLSPLITAANLSRNNLTASPRNNIQSGHPMAQSS